LNCVREWKQHDKEKVKMRKVKEEELVGKTIKSIENKSINVLELTFTDGSVVKLCAENAIYTSFGSIPGILVEDDPVDTSETPTDSRW
jgi:hypothetical protein